MKYLLGKMVRREYMPGWESWCAPDFADKVIDLRPVAVQGNAKDFEGYCLFATERDPLPEETLIAGASNETLSSKATDAIKDLLAIPEAVTAQTMPELIRVLLGIYSDPSVGLICPPVMPDRRGNVRFRLGEIAVSYPCPKSGTEWDNILKIAQEQYRSAKESGTDSHRKLLSVLKDKFRIEDHEIFIPSDLPKETPVKPSTTLQDNFDVGSHADIDDQASSDGWIWEQWSNSGALSVVRTDTTAYAEGQTSGSVYRAYRAEQDLSSVDHYVQAEMRTESVNFVPIIGARKDSSTTFTWYECQLGAGSDLLWILKVVSGSGTTLQTNAMTINTATWYTIKFNITGSTLQTFNSGSQVGTDLTDTAIASGLRTGIRIQGNAGTVSGGFENFEASDGLADPVGGGAAYLHRKQLGA